MNDQDNSPSKKRRPRRPIRTERPVSPPEPPEPPANPDRDAVEQSDLFLRWATPGARRWTDPERMPKLSATQIEEILRKRDEFGAKHGEGDIEITQIGYIDKEGLRRLASPPDDGDNSNVPLWHEQRTDVEGLIPVFTLPEELHDIMAADVSATESGLPPSLLLWLEAAGIDVDSLLIDLEAERTSGTNRRTLEHQLHNAQSEAHRLDNEVRALKQQNAELLSRAQRPSWWDRTLIKIEDWIVPKRGLSLDAAQLRDDVWVINTVEDAVGSFGDVMFVYEVANRQRVFKMHQTWLPYKIQNVERLALFSSAEFKHAVDTKAITLISASYARKLMSDKDKTALEQQRLDDLEAMVRKAGAPRTFAESNVEIFNPEDFMNNEDD